jgi:hypothetical protein
MIVKRKTSNVLIGVLEALHQIHIRLYTSMLDIRLCTSMLDILVTSW